MKDYYVGWSAGWFIVRSRTLRGARRAGREEYGVPATRLTVRLATASEISSYLSQKGQIEEVEY